MAFEILPWDVKHPSACRILDLTDEVFPSTQRVDRSEAVTFLAERTEGFESTRFVVLCEGIIQGFVMLSKSPSPDRADLVGVVHPAYRRRGLGALLYDRMMIGLAERPELTRVRATAFRSLPAGHGFLMRRGFEYTDEVFWSSYATAQTLPSWTKAGSLDSGAIRFVRGHKFEMMRPDWDRVWWALVMNTAVDIPSRIGHQRVSFDEWRRWMDPPFTDRSNTILALDGDEPIALLSLGKVSDGKVNIHYTGVHREYRRRGLSVALKVKAVALARSLGASTVTTQNHQDNPMFALNQRLGFQVTDSAIEYLLTR